MKKLLVILSVIMALCICLTSCNIGGDKNQGGDVQANVGSGGSSSNNNNNNNKPEGDKGSVNDSKQAIIDAFAKFSDVEALFDELQNGLETEVNLDEVYAELLKLEYQAAFDASATIEGETGNIGGYAALNNGNVYVNLEVSADDFNETESAYGFFTEDMKYVMVVGDGNGGYNTQVMDFGMYLNVDDMMGDIESEAPGSVLDMVKGFKLPALEESEISVNDGKYIISKDYWNKVVDYTISYYVDSVKESGGEIDEENFAEIKDMAKTVLDNVEFELFFRMNGSQFIGFGVNLDVTAADLEAAIGESMDGEFVSANLKFDIKTNGKVLEYVDLDMNVVADEETNMGMDMKFRLDSIFDGDKLAGFTMFEDATVITSYYVGNYDEETGIKEEVQVVQQINIDATATLDLTKMDVAGADVLVFNMDVTEVQDGEVDDGVAASGSLTARGNNEFDFSFNFVEKDDAEDAIYASGSFSYSENASDFPEIPSSVIDAKDEALANYVPGQGGIGGGFGDKVEDYPMPPEVEEDYNG